MNNTTFQTQKNHSGEKAPSVENAPSKKKGRDNPGLDNFFRGPALRKQF